MSIPFSFDEIIQMACQIERNGGRFYRAASKVTPEGPAKELLLKLAEQEDSHFETFEAMQKEFSSIDAKQTTHDPHNEITHYLNLIADDHVFNLEGDKPAGLLNGDEGAEEILRLALQAEKDTIVFFSGLKELLSREADKRKIEAIIREEMSHIRWLKSRKLEE